MINTSVVMPGPITFQSCLRYPRPTDAPSVDDRSSVGGLRSSIGRAAIRLARLVSLAPRSVRHARKILRVWCSFRSAGSSVLENKQFGSSLPARNPNHKVRRASLWHRQVDLVLPDPG